MLIFNGGWLFLMTTTPPTTTKLPHYLQKVTHDIPYTQHHTLFPYHLFPLFSSFRGMSISNISPTIGQEIVKPLFEWFIAQNSCCCFFHPIRGSKDVPPAVRSKRMQLLCLLLPHHTTKMRGTASGMAWQWPDAFLLYFDFKFLTTTLLLVPQRAADFNRIFNSFVDDLGWPPLGACSVRTWSPARLGGSCSR